MSEYKISHELSEALAKRRKQMFPAQILGPESQLLSTGEALLEGAPPHGVYWPNHPVHKDILPSTVTLLNQRDQTKIAAIQFELCHMATTTPHYHFRIVEEWKE